jgi:hypothetical protein
VRTSVDCEATPTGWRCAVRVGEDAGATRHAVTVERATLDDLARGSSVEELVAASFAFLLEREPRESILREFDLPVIGRYFPEYDEEIRRRLGG